MVKRPVEWRGVLQLSKFTMAALNWVIKATEPGAGTILRGAPPIIQLHASYVSWQDWGLTMLCCPFLTLTAPPPSPAFSPLCLRVKVTVMVVFALICGGTTGTQNVIPSVCLPAIYSWTNLLPSPPHCLAVFISFTKTFFLFAKTHIL